MIEKNNGNSVKSSSSQNLEENDNEISNFKLLYRKTPKPERDKSSGASSDEETTSSSILPIPETLKQIKNKSKWTLTESGDHYASEPKYGCSRNDKSSGNIMNSLDEIRKKYTFKNERSVAMKMDSANMMLDDILTRANFIKSSTESLQTKSYKEDLEPKFIPENESSITENSITHPQPCPHMFDHSHIPIAVDFLNSQCHKHCNAFQHSRASSCSIDKGTGIPKENLALIQRKRSFAEKIQNLQLGCRIQSMYKFLHKTKNPFARNTKVPENLNLQQGIPGADCQKNILIQNEILAYHCGHNQCTLKHYQKQLNSPEPSEICSSESKNFQKGDQQCTCMIPKPCNCPEIIPKCICSDSSGKCRHKTSDTPKRISEGTQATQPVSPKHTMKDSDSSLISQQEVEEMKRKQNKCPNDCPGWRRIEQKELIQRTDIYYFDHGNSAYYKTTDDHPKRITEGVVEKADEYLTNFWAEFFGTFEIGIAFIISFILQLYRFLFTSIIRSLLVGLIQISSDYFFKPLLTILFNGIIQPCLILGYNIATSFRDLCLPISQTFGFYTKELANIINSCRLIEINRDRQPPSYYRNKV